MPLSPASVKTTSATVIVVAAIYALTSWGKQAALMKASGTAGDDFSGGFLLSLLAYLIFLVVAVIVWIRSLKNLG